MSCSVKGRGYTVSVYFVDKLTSNELMKRLKSKGLRNSDYTRAVIKDKLNDNDHEIATTSCKVSLACPLGKPLGGGDSDPLCLSSSALHFSDYSFVYTTLLTVVNLLLWSN
jgi:hypothetical protein